MKRQAEKFSQTYPTVKVFAAAVHAYNINEGYFKVVTFSHLTNNAGDQIAKRRNIDIVVQCLQSPVDPCTADDYAKANLIIEYYQGKLIDLMSGKLNSYSQAACQVANKETVDSLIEIGLVSSLPKAYESSVQFDSMLEEKERAFAVSRHFGSKGDNYRGRVKIISCVYSQKWFRYFLTAKDVVTNNVVNFSTNFTLDLGKELAISGRIKDHVESGVTRLNYVKVSIDAAK
jgi:hypothetical protein